MRWAALAVILSIAVLRSTVMILIVPVFDVDPARDPTVGIGIGPAVSLLFEALLLLASGAALFAEVRAGRGLSRWCVALAVLPAISVLWWASMDAMDAFRGLTWLSSASAFAALAHLVRDRGMRVVAISVLLATMAPLAVRGLEQAFVEHAATVSQFEATKAQLFAERGWEVDSSAARTYTRRLTQREATGWFGLSNPYSSMMACAAVALVGGAWSAWRRRVVTRMDGEEVARGIACTVSLCAALALCMLAINFGKGAIAAMSLGFVVLLWGCTGQREARPRWIMFAACIAFFAIILRSWFGENFPETSLYLRSLYLEGALGAYETSPRLGVGPDGLQSLFMQSKPPECAEDIQSAHSVFIDWLVLLGPVAIAWVTMLVLSLRGRIAVQRAEGSDASELSRTGMRLAFAIVIIGLVLQARVEGPILDAFSLCLRAAGWMLFVALAACLAYALAAACARVLVAIVVAVGVVVMAHAQIEMTFFLPGSVVWMSLMLACATTLGLSSASSAEAEHSPQPPVRGAWLSQVLALTPVVLSGFALYFAVREYRVEERLERAAEIVRPLAEVRDAWTDLSKAITRGSATENTVDRFMDAVVVASAPIEIGQSAGSLPFGARMEDALSTRNLDGAAKVLVDLDVALRTLAAEELLRANPEETSTPDWNRLPREAAVKQLAVAGRRALGSKSAEFHGASLNAAIRLTRGEHTSRLDLRMLFMRCDLLWERLQAERRRGDSEESIRFTAEAMRWDFTRAANAAPYSPMRWVLLGDVQEIAGHLDLARTSWKQAQVVNAALHLDPLAQLSERLIAELEAKQAR